MLDAFKIVSDTQLTIEPLSVTDADINFRNNKNSKVL